MVRLLMTNPTFIEHQIMKYTGCSLERAREVEPLMRELTPYRVHDMSFLRFEALAIEAETGIAIAHKEA
jgi:hypothetical protein